MEEEISKEEFALADELKGFCTAYGREREETLSGSADVLMRMGQLYMSKASEATSKKKSQKFSFIRCAALLHGAKVRFSKTKNSGKISEVMAVLQNLDKHLKMACSFTKLPGKLDLSEMSEKIKKQLIDMREEKEKTLKSLPKIPDDIDQEQAHVLEKEKISKIRKLLEESTKDYKNIMCQIAEKCVELLGEPPCKFALVGLGSMAREEITLYSDFEHVIVLEEGVQDLENYGDVQEYFRWYAVMFQIIVVGLGETFIRSVGVPSISDLNTDDKATNWYFDVWTPCGVAFDGMVPHACHNPLGRHYTTKMGKPPHELIQPAGKMAQYLCSDEHIKNGYYLKGVLSRTCWVFGNFKVYQCFKDSSESRLNEASFEETLKDQKSLITGNHNINVWAPRLGDPSLKQDIKFVLYRPFSTLLASAAKIFRLRPLTSSMSILEEMFRKSVINKMDLHVLLYAFAAICELRLKAYSIVGHQRTQVAYSELAELVGKKSAVDCCTVTGHLREFISLCIGSMQIAQFSIAHAQNIMMPFEFNFRQGGYIFPDLQRILGPVIFGNPGFHRALAHCNFGYCEEAIALAKNVLQQKNVFPKGCIHHLLGDAYRNLATEMNQPVKNRHEFLDQAEKSYRNALQSQDLNEADKTHCGQLLADILEMQGRNQEGLDSINQYLKEDCVDEVEQVRRQRFYRCHEMRFNSELMEADEYERYMSDRVCQEKEIHTKFFLQLAMVGTYLKSGKKKIARNLLSQTTNAIQENILQLKHDRVLEMQCCAMAFQLKQKWADDLLKTFTHFHEMPEKGGKMESVLRELGIFDFAEFAFHFNSRDFKASKIALESLEISKHMKTQLLIDCYLGEAASFGPTHSEKMLLVKNAIDLCKSSPGEECLEDGYAAAIAFQWGAARRNDFNEVMRTFSDAPLGVQRHESLVSQNYLWVYKNFRIFETRATTETYDHEVRMRLTSVMDVFSELVVHPVIGYMFLTLVNYDVIQQDRASMKALNDLRRQILEKYRIYGEGCATKMYNRAVECFADLRLEECAGILWDLLNGRYGAGQFVKCLSATLLLSLVVVFMQVADGYRLDAKNKYLIVVKNDEVNKSEIHSYEEGEWSGHRGLCIRHRMVEFRAKTNKYDKTAADELSKILKDSSEIIVHPITGYKYTSLMKYLPIQQDHHAMDLLKNVQQRMIARLIIRGGSHDASLYNDAVRCYANFDIAGCASKIWRVLMNVSPEMFIGRAAVELLLCLLIVSLDIYFNCFD